MKYIVIIIICIIGSYIFQAVRFKELYECLQIEEQNTLIDILITYALNTALLIFVLLYLILIIRQQKTIKKMKIDFAHNMTHELKTPIANSLAIAGALLYYEYDDEEHKTHLKACVDQLLKLRESVEQILSVSTDKLKKIILNLEDIELKPIIKQLVEVQRLKIEKAAEIRIQINPENLSIKADRFHLTNILNNLIDNSIKYSCDKVKIEIETYRENRFTVLKIKDTGIGISLKDQKFIFEKYYRVTKDNENFVEGHGLGLFYTKMIIEKHKGTISVESSRRGSVFTIKIPL